MFRIPKTVADRRGNLGGAKVHGRHFPFLIIGISILALAVPHTVRAQPPWMMGGGPPGGFGGGPPGMFGGPPGSPPSGAPTSITGNPDIDRRVQFYEGMFRQLDTNQDGVVSPEELSQSRMAEYLSSRLRDRFGVDPSNPFRIDEVRQKVIDYYKQASQGNQPQQGQPSQGTQPASPNQPQTQTQTTILRMGPNVPVPGFGPPAAMSSAGATVPGFGNPNASATVGSGVTTGAGSGSPPASQVQTASAPLMPPPAPLDERIRRYAESLMRQYDENRNGKLEKNEWEKLRGSDWAKADRDGNGELTLEEIAQHLAAESGMSSGSSSSGSTKASPTSGKRFIQRSPWERLPDNLPSWFKDRDKDRDGQVTMAEFSDRWTTEKLREFQRYDLNGDGIITPQECLKSR